MEITFKYGDRNLKLTPYNTIQEKEILLMASFQETEDISELLPILKDNINHDISDYSIIEQKMILYKLRTVSVGDDIGVRYMCSCGRVNENNISIPFPKDKVQDLKFNDLELHNMVGKYEDVINHVNVTETYLDELDLEIYEKLEQHIKSNFINIDLTGSCDCFSCGKTTLIDISSDKYLIESMSEDSLMNIYTIISDMVFYSHYNKSDIDNMLPFERTIFYELLLKARKENNS